MLGVTRKPVRCDVVLVQWLPPKNYDEGDPEASVEMLKGLFTLPSLQRLVNPFVALFFGIGGPDNLGRTEGGRRMRDEVNEVKDSLVWWYRCF